MNTFDNHLCTLGEGPLWHPDRQVLFWFDINAKALHASDGKRRQSWQFDEHFSAAGLVDRDTLLMASETGLWRFDIGSGDRQRLCDLEADNPLTRSNDGRADPWGGFWIGTMGKEAEPNAGAIWRYYRGELRQLVPDVTISNAICFAPDKSCAYYTDTVTQQVMRQPLEPKDGWPEGPPAVLADFSEARLNPDGAVTDTDGNIWIAMWGGYCILCLGPDGSERQRIEAPARQPTCPAWGGSKMRDLFLTSATRDLRPSETEARPLNGATFVIRELAQGAAEPRVVL